jgi:hypothetical protein
MADFSKLDNRAAWLKEEKGRIEVGPASVAQPEKGEILVRVRSPLRITIPIRIFPAKTDQNWEAKVQASAIQPIDAKIARLALMKLKYPTTQP